MTKAKLDLEKFLSGGRAAQQAVDDAIAAHGGEHLPLCGKKRRESGHVLHCDKALDHTGSCSFDEGQK
jgi:hypothetical protein